MWSGVSTELGFIWYTESGELVLLRKHMGFILYGIQYPKLFSCFGHSFFLDPLEFSLPNFVQPSCCNKRTYIYYPTKDWCLEGHLRHLAVHIYRFEYVTSLKWPHEWRALGTIAVGTVAKRIIPSLPRSISKLHITKIGAKCFRLISPLGLVILSIPKSCHADANDCW